MLSNKERQIRFKEKMYESGFKQTIVWVKRKEGKRVTKMKQDTFMKKLQKITSEWDDGELSETLNFFIKIAEAKKEVIKLRDKR
jgi:hypothetical protein